MSDHGEHPSVYYDGRECRRSGGSKLASPFASHTFHGSWFLADWNDMDLEIEQKNPKRAAKNKAA
ncbi:hypothetical protein [Pseudomonas putida]|uniref:Uncharacterized protein n=1 Tax=Pseudomonas putida TaxID=303 RepID=A0A7V8EJ98_PSEPU|nr:hypothetical protein [Pseudomonas putida]KAF0255878.1 hypothetical protein GN299_05225 [Pseudomonas putida]WQE52009.1 hypothetical protein U0028_19260 [Pseudomonas putida]GLO05646.1 hypothetical protein PPUJ13061_55500 [Pseudomonas putida]HDS1009081.1 hypothetical protein [Pseudomonas putida]